MDTTPFWVMALRPFILFFIVIPFLTGVVRLVRRFAPPRLKSILLYKLWTADHEK